VIFQIDPNQVFNVETLLVPLITVIILFLLMAIMVVLYLKVRVFVIIAVVFLFSLVIGSMSMETSNLPFTPYIQLFFVVFQAIIFFLTTLGVFTAKK
jgi:hypothetical protein